MRISQPIWAISRSPPNPPAIDPLYDALLTSAQKSAGISGQVVKAMSGAKGELFKEIAKVASAGEANSFRAALALGITGDATGLAILLENLPQYSTAQRAAISSKLYEPSKKDALLLLSKLVRDPVEEIRSDAVESALSTDNTAAFLAMVLEALTEPGSPLSAHQFYSYSFESAARDRGQKGRALRNWAASTLKDPDASPSNQILALIALRKNFPSSSLDTALSLAKSSPDKWVRRAAWYSYAGSSSSGLAKNLDALAEDPSPFVREVLPELASRIDSSWHHCFNDVQSVRANSWDSDRKRNKMNSAVGAVLEKFAASDPSPDVRFTAMCALLSQGRDIDATAFSALLRSRPEEDRASYRVADWMQENLSRLGPGLASVVSALNPAEVKPEHMAAILTKVSPPSQDGAGFASFAALAASASGDPGAAPQQVAAIDEDQGEEPASERETLRLVYFFKPGCAECEKVNRLLETMENDFTKLEIQRHNINETKSTLLNQALCARFLVPSASHNIAPAVFSQSGFLIREDILPASLGRLLSDTSSLAQDDSWSEIEAPEIAAAKVQVEKRYESLTLPVVLLAGLIDGINPCAFATIIFFLSYLQIARRSPREMLMVGSAFIFAVFLAYFLAGLVLHGVLAQLTDHISGIKPYLDWAFAGLALLAAALSFRDAAKARAGKLDEMTLTLPAFLKDRIRGVIRTGAKARRFVIAAFLAGIVISFLELACTGQVYAPIIYSIQQGRLDAVAWLLAYNLAFIIPLIVIFALAFTGMSNKTLIDFQTRHTFSVKIALGLVFLALAAVILFGARLL